MKAQFSAASLALQVYKKQQEIAKLDSMAQQALEQAEQHRRQQQDEQGQQAWQANGAGWPVDGVAGSAAAAEEEAVPLQHQQRQQQQRQQQQQGDAAGAAALAAAAAAAERGKLEEESLPLMLDAMWAANRLDIEATLRHVCKRLLNDPQVRAPPWWTLVTPWCIYKICSLNESVHQPELPSLTWAA
jgi:high-affinity Fe2+/Pb2+ permease